MANLNTIDRAKKPEGVENTKGFKFRVHNKLFVLKKRNETDLDKELKTT